MHPTVIRRLPLALLVAASLLAVPAVAGATTTTQAHRSSTPRTLELKTPTYQPVAQPGSTDDYHCTLFDPKLESPAYVTSTQFHPGSGMDHHAALFLIPPDLAAAARAENSSGKGWTCFGEAGLPHQPLADILRTPFLTVWAPGHGADALPKGTGVEMPAGSLLVLQVHYNLLAGHRPVSDRVSMSLQPGTAKLIPLSLNLSFAPPDLPCPKGSSGPLCDRAASLADQGQRFGADAVSLVNTIETVCGRAPSPPAGTSTSCTWPVQHAGWVVRTQAHMHLLGTGFSLVAGKGTKQSATLLRVPRYDFHDQRAYTPKRLVHVSAGESLTATCRYDPSLMTKLPALRSTPAHFVTWGDGSTDEMCIGLAWVAPVRPPSMLHH